MNNKASMCLSVFCFLYSSMVCAESDILELTIGAWDHDPSGYVQYQGGLTDLERDMKLEKEQEGFVRLNIAHGVPLLPNLQFGYTKLGHAGSGIVNSSFTFGGTTYNVSENIVTDMTMDQTDIVLFYSPLDNVAEFDLGLDIRRLDGQVLVNSTTTSNTELRNFDAYLPLLYARVGFDMPFTGLSIGASGAGISYDDNRMTDLSAYVRYKFSMLGIEGGYRQMNLRADDLDGVAADIDLEGPYIAMMLNF